MKYAVDLQDYWSRIDLSKTPLHPSGGHCSVTDQKSGMIYLYGGNPCDQSVRRNNKIISFNTVTREFDVVSELAIPDRLNHRMFYSDDNRIHIIGGHLFRQAEQDATIIIYSYCIESGELETFDTGIENRGQFGCAFYEVKNTLYLYGGFGKNDHYEIDLEAKKVREMPTFTKHGRAGMLYQMMPDGRIFIFSGFSVIQDEAVCHNDYIVFDPSAGNSRCTKLKEPFGRTFSKSVVIESLNKLLIFGGTINGMEGSGHFYFYDYKSETFNHAGIDPLPGTRVEPSMNYSVMNNSLYLFSGLVPRGNDYKALDEVMILDMSKLDEDVWSGHP